MRESEDQSQNPSSLLGEVEDRFGVLPNFFRLAPEAPEITQNLWGFARFGYLDNPLPSLFKERLFVYLSQFCEVRYCISRHVGFLIGLGNPSGDRDCPPETVEDIVRLLRRRLPRGKQLDPHIHFCESRDVPMAELPLPETTEEESVFACATHVFLQTVPAARCLEALRQALAGDTFQHLLVFLTFVRTAHFWTKVHPELQHESDITELLNVHEALAECVLLDPAEAESDSTQVLLDELVELRDEREQAELLRVTLASIGDAVIATDAQGRITTLNAVAEELTGWSSAEVSGRSLESVFQIVNEQTRAPVPNPAERALREGVIVGLANHTLLIARDGTERPIEDSAAPIRSRDGRILGCVLVFRDVTERRRLERENAEREKNARLLASIITSSEDAIISKTLDGVIQTWNAAAERIFGYTPEEAVGQHISMLIPAVRLGEEELIVSKLRAGERVEHFDTVRLRKDGRPFPVSLTISPIKNADGEVIGASKIARDISDRKRAEVDLKESQERARLAMEAGELGGWNIDPVTEELTTDERFRIIFQGSPTPITYEEAFAALHPDDRERIRDAVVAATRPDDPASYAEEYRVIHPDGSIRWVFARGRANFEMTDAGRRLTSFDGTVMDITEQHRMREELRETAARLSEADRRKDEFLATLAHELRNPLAPIRTGLEALKMAADDPQIREEIRETMERQTEQMVHLVDDLLDVSRITRGQLQLRIRRIELADVAQSAVEATRPIIDEAGHELTVAFPNEPILLDADPTRLAQILSNLLNNAAKYTPEPGKILLRTQTDDSHVVITVKDTGRGIPLEMQSDIFEMFGQIDYALEGGYTGLGIGLTLVKSLVELHGGTIDIYSEGADTGSEFTIRLPHLLDADRSARADEPSDKPSEETSRLRILVVDDNTAAADILSMLVKMFGHDVRTANDGVQAVEIAADFRPNVLLMDIGMPRMNGYEAARHIRQQPWGADMTLIALTGWGQEDDKQKTRDAGFDHHLVKPAEPAALQQLLSTVSG